MLRYIGRDEYEFVNENNKTIILTKNDIDTICDLAMKDSNFEIGKEMKNLAEKSLHWQELYNELRKDRDVLYKDILILIQKHKIEED